MTIGSFPEAPGLLTSPRWLRACVTFTFCCALACGPLETEDTADEGSPATLITQNEPLAFRVLTYNVRQVNSADKGAYTWANRSANVMKVIAAHYPDVFGVQEASAKVIQQDLIAAFGGTHGYYKPPNGSPKMIFFRKGRFQLAPGESTGFAAVPNPYPKSHACHPNANGRTYAWARLVDLVAKRSYFVVNIHPSHGAKCGTAREVYMAAVHKTIAQKSGGLPVIAFGDFNSDPQASNADPGDHSIEMFETGGKGFTLYRTARHTGVTTKGEATMNSSWKSPREKAVRLDYIFHSGNDLTSAAQGIDDRLFKGVSPSDHFAVYATIRPSLFHPGARSHVAANGKKDTTRYAFADANGDGCADKFSWNPTLNGGDTLVAMSLCNGKFKAPMVSNGAGSVSENTQFYFADVNGDACADKMYWNRNFDGGRMRVYLSKCDGNFHPVISEGNPASGGETTQFHFARINKDACADLIYWNHSVDSGRTRVFLSRCNGRFEGPVSSSDGAQTTSQTARFYFADVTGDGLEDKLTWDPNANGGATRLFKSKGNGTFAFVSQHRGGTSVVDTSRFYFADVSGDGRADKVFWRPTFREGRMQIYLGTSTAPRDVSHLAMGYGP